MGFPTRMKDEKTATVEVSEDQQSLAIGKGGQNVRLAAKLTGWKIDIKGVGGVDLEKKKKEETPLPTSKEAEETKEEEMPISTEEKVDEVLAIEETPEITEESEIEEEK